MENKNLPAIEINNLSFSFQDQLVLDNINLTIRNKEFIGIIGPNGGGKTTLLKILLGLLKPNKGEVKIFGKSPAKNLKYLGYVPQYSNFDKSYPISVHDVVLMGMLGRTGFGTPLKKENPKVAEVLEKVELTPIINKQIGELSGGQLQRVLIARALISNPNILLLDEPTASIDSKSGKSFYDLLQSLNDDMTIVLVSHDIGAISRFVKKIACLNKTLIYHDSKEISVEMIEATYHCPVDLIAHGVPHRVLDESEHSH
ncbi:MAG: ABC transporter ATP-binding protein [Melioribacteraceae bacterium]|nr:ABC transporter ATP-binding protein [Melioribacteraceae bacterium]MCF8353793.1 ABC transporter ATP-binding protein [Melioribacteraceae bacterium]MCF8393629.1 ABC transporter ATP-binding protein [Melioribacteraceae bacterium]MCF8419439.1 ABC transporter ATP-binding protein [Melioribacteraceae bacterium]